MTWHPHHPLHTRDMKVTAIIPDDLLRELRQQAPGKTLTESLILALRDWISLKNIQDLNRQVRTRPLRFKERLGARTLRQRSRRR